MKVKKTLIERDKEAVWHPYTQHKTASPFLPIDRAKGIYLIDDEENRYIDAISSWWTNIHGHAHPYIAKKIYDQALELEHVIFAGCTHQPAVLLAEKVLELLPPHFAKIFYSDNGSTAVEVALKMAIQYHKNENGNKRKRILALHHSYHGDTFGAMSVGAKSLFTDAFKEFLFDATYINPALDPHLIEQPENIMAFIYEPLLQGAGGMRMYQPEGLERILKFCKNHNIICIADEVLTGFGRTGKFFASEFVSEQPDIICLSKALTGGVLPLSITAVSQKIYDRFYNRNFTKTFFHGHSFTANPLACAASLASLDLLKKDNCFESIRMISNSHQQFIQELSKDKLVIQPRFLGTVLAFEVDQARHDYSSNLRNVIIDFCLKNKVFLRPLGNTIYLMPPYCITNKELHVLYETVRKLLHHITENS